MRSEGGPNEPLQAPAFGRDTSSPELERAARLAVDYLGSLEARRVSTEVDPRVLRKRLARPLADDGSPPLAVIEELKPLRVLSLTHKDLSGASAILRRFHDQELTLADAMGLHIMREHRIASCWSTDFHLGLTGARLAIHEG